MTSSASHSPDSWTLRRAAQRAVLAPSVHNTQPWRLVLREGTLELWADRSRRLPVLDPTGRQLTISCGCALFNARVTVAAEGFDPRVDLLPDPDRPDLLARITAVPRWGVRGNGLAELDEAVEVRRTNRRRFVSESLPDDLLAALVRAAAAEGAELHVVQDAAERARLAQLCQHADETQQADPAYRAEVMAWTTTDPQRRDGVQAMSVPHVEPESHDELPIRDFDAHGMGWLPVATQSDRNQCLLLLGNSGDDVPAWLAAGQALERVLLEVTRAGYVASPLTQVVEVSADREALRRELTRGIWPHVLLRVGRAPDTPPSLRRPMFEMIETR